MNLPPPFVPDESVLTGVGASSGIAIGPARVFSHKNLHIPDFRFPTHLLIEPELQRLEKARTAVREKLSASKASLPSELKSQAGIIDAYLLLLDDPIFIKNIVTIIKDELRNAEQAVVRAIETISALLANVEDEYISSRLADIEMLGYSIIEALMGGSENVLFDAPEGSILVVHDINPSDVAKLAAAKAAGLATATGGHTSHTAIVAQAMEIPAVVGVKNLVANVNNGDTIILDGRTGHVIIHPDEDSLNFYRTRQKMERSFNAEIVRSSHLPAITLDDRYINVMGNLELEEELPAIMSYGGEGIGLYRTEFMYMNRRELPSEEEQFDVYRRVVESVAPHPVIIRTLDLGYDKQLDESGRLNFGQESRQNQALGLRGIRYCLRNRPMFKTQLRAILRASAFGNVKIMLPMVSSIDELRKTRAMVTDIQHSLSKSAIAYASRIDIGIMIEVPATIFIARELASEAAFFSIGTNDLIQYSLAVDRGDPEVSELFQPLHPAILKMLQYVFEVSRQTETPVSVCGDMAAGEITAAILVGLGADTLSMPPAAIPKIKRIIRMASYSELCHWARDIANSKTAAEANTKAVRHVRGKFPELFR